MRAVVLVGGFGTRLRPLTLSTPKQMLPVVGVTMLERVIGWLAGHGVDEAVLSLGYLPDAFTEAFPDGRCRGVQLTYAVEPEPLDTAGAIAFAARSAGIEERFLAINGDVLTDADVGSLVAAHDAAGAAATIMLTPVDDPSRYGVVERDAAGRVLQFVEKPPPGEEPSHHINAGQYVLEPSVLELIAPGAPCSIEREVFPALVARGTLHAVASDAYWIDAGTPEALLRANLDLIDGVRGHEIAISPSSSIDPDAVVEHSVIGAGVVVRAGAEVRDSVVMAGAWLDEGVVIDGSIVGTGAKIKGPARVTDLSVVGCHHEVPGGTKLSGSVAPSSDTWT